MPATVIVGAQWGDEGKGKIVDLLAQDSDVVCRYQGGPNAGHTIIAEGETFKLRQQPSGFEVEQRRGHQQSQHLFREQPGRDQVRGATRSRRLPADRVRGGEALLEGQ